MEKCVESECKDSTNGLTSRVSAIRCFFKQRSISSSISVPIRIAPAWGRMLRFGNTSKIKIDELFQVFNDINCFGLNCFIELVNFAYFESSLI